jgi:hypothetical protein
MRELSPREWLRRVQEKLSQKYQVDAAELHFGPAPPRYAAFVRGPPPATGKKKTRRPRRWDIVVVDVAGQKRSQFRVLTAPGSDEPPKDLRFLDEERLVYEVVESPPPPPKQTKTQANKQAKKKKATKRGSTQSRKQPPKPSRKVSGPDRVAAPEPPALPRRTFVVQPIARRARAVRCQGVRFAFTTKHDRLAFVGGKPDAAFVAVNGVQVYPRRGRTVIGSELAWSRDGLGLAFLETPARKPARLVLLAAYDNPRADTSWELPPSAPVEGTRVFWPRPGRLVVGKTTARPVFTASFLRDDAAAGDTFTP